MKRPLFPILIAVLLTAALSGCQGKEAPPAATAPADPSLVTVPADFLQRLKIAPADEGEATETLRVPARIEVDEQRVARIGATVTGRVTQIHATLGQRVKRGEQLATLHSTELSAAQLAYLKALSQTELQRRAVERAKLLFASDVIGAAELQKRESELAQAQAEMQASQGQLGVLGMTESAMAKLAASRTVHSLSSITATLDGAVIERKVTPGQVVQPADALFTVADLSHVWLVAEVPEQQAALIKKGESAQAEIPALNGKRIEGRLIYVADIVNPERRTVTVRMDVDNPDRLLKPEMLASMLIQGAPQRRLVVPAAAVVREDNKDHVFVQLDGTRFQLRPVVLGQESNGYVPVQSGLKGGEPIVTEGAFHLNNERKRKELEG
ncbi:MAG: efflux RND transporter periplasmic adaptor subunit [Sulfurimicrobium sp.]|nr:efflux RND transporter periplasmic adaptor subunit [Sulfurimicrobium sp.]MDP1706166.1 efflux RND transporter periplasmic adaptor subunit [Sulfurimicrobium sp.]MDP1898323.1 efflux RND transporter periplasmic adaptor subunit [Sulfurimicrobium sp.]MDP2199897.1 efflux RND transporter periplasmic adaptor subunit [Sulfurimicrobium sp.]MDP3689060.1 efflux RND transporter periplasmic adaptor subunit [Sulfurimicrobium sp.]